MAAARVSILPLLAVLIVGCGGPSPSAAPNGGIALLTQDSPATSCPAARTEGALVRDERSGLGLANRDLMEYPVIWPFGYSARDDGGRLALLDATGKVVAHEGDRVAVGGGEMEAGTWLGCGGIIPL